TLATGATKKWYNANTGGTAYAGTELLTTGTYYVSQTTTGCESARTSVSVTVNPTPAAPTASAQTFCSVEGKTVNDLAVTLATGATKKWYNTNTGGTAYAGTELLTTGTYYVSQTTTGCESARTSVSVTINPTPAAPVASAQTFCSVEGKTVNDLAVTLATGATKKWYNANTGGTAYAGTELLTTGTYYVSQTTTGCESTRTSVSVTVNPTPAAPTALAQTFCSVEGKTVNDLAVTLATGATKKWYNTNTGGTAYAGTELLATGTYYVSQTTTGCESARTLVSVTVNPTPAAPAASAQTFCSVEGKTVNDLAVTLATGATKKWYNTNTGGTAYAGTELLTTGTYYVSQTTTGCESTRTSVSVTIDTTPSQPLLSSITQQTCSTATGSFTILNYDASYTYIVSPSTGVTQTGNIIKAPVGSYTIIAKINSCESSSASAVIDSKICANEDKNFGTQVSGTTVTSVGNVTTNDTLNGQFVTSANTNVTPKTTGPLSVDADGGLTLAANTPSGTYSIDYTICEEGSATNCSTATATVVVGNILVANEDKNFGEQVSGTTVTSVGNVTTNDTLNGEFVTSANTNVTPKTTGPLSVDADGGLTLAANTPSGTYSIDYTICEEGAATNCSTATATVVVGNILVANEDKNFGTQASGTSIVSVGNVTTNDTLNGQFVTSANTNVTPKTTGPLSVDADGGLTLAANTPSGTYSIDYTICEEGAATNCSTATATVVVGNILVANEDKNFGTQVSGTTVTSVGNVTTNDTLNGEFVTSANTNVTPKTTGPLSVDANGGLTLAANTPSGTYSIDYTICEEGSATNCSTATATVVVGNILVANEDKNFGTQTSGTSIVSVGNVTTNDTLNGQFVTSANTNVTPKTTGPLSIDANGGLTLAANTPSGTYSIDYTICEEGAGTNCSTATATVVVGNILVANEDKNFGTQVSGTTVTSVGNVTTNDTLNGQFVTSANTNVTPKTTGPLSVDADGGLTLAANTPSGTYSIDYTICEEGAGTNCSTATATVVVGNGVLNAVPVTTLPINGSIGGTTVSIINGTLNGTPVVISNNPGGVVLTPVNVPTGLILNANGTITVNAGTPIGLYEVEYRICEYLNPANCVTVKSYVPVTGATLQANNDNAGTVNSTKGEHSTTNIFNNDTLNGSVLNPKDVVLTTTVANPNLILKADGTIEVKPGTLSGSYELTYQICEALNPGNCSQAVVKISVVNIEDPAPPVTPKSKMVLTNDQGVSVDGINGSLEFINVLGNDLLNGYPIKAADIVITNTPKSPYFEFNADGTVNVRPNTPGGTYVLTYQVCEKADLSNCNTATLTVFVEFPAIAVIKTAVSNDENGNGYANAGETITYKFKVTNTGNVPLSGVMISDPLPGVVVLGQPIDLDVNESDENNFTAIYKITQSDINKGSVSNQAKVKGTSLRGVTVEDMSDDENNTEDKPTVLPLSGCVIKVFNAFSPNGDSKNSRFYIQGLECYPDNTVEIYNRWGVLVYDIDKYNNEDRAFKGFSEGRTTVKQSDGLPVGTYFYILKYKDSESNPHELSGYLYINK
ncbi:gliding motility-associated C-terminal domain-containing protein, partial [Flavobacterium sp. FlaQc-48]|uniref:Ig-like domain-containing protein n=1 Tax=Flavobacterium sp. FlaQc-48 TaxID=3374181 RepID=UPI003757AA69